MNDLVQQDFDPGEMELLTGDGNALIPVDEETRGVLAALKDKDSGTAVIVRSETMFRSQLQGDLRQKLKKRNIAVKAVITVPQTFLDLLYTDSYQLSSPAEFASYDRLQHDVVTLLATAAAEDVSDIHIESSHRTATVKFRNMGKLRTYETWHRDKTEQMCRYIYDIMCHDQDVTWNPREPQDGVMETALPSGQTIRVRVSTNNISAGGYDMVLRILPISAELIGLPELGYTRPQMKTIEELIRRPSGLVVVAGRIGSGKSTSLAAMLTREHELRGGETKIITVEDPPEREIPGARQIPVVRHKNTSADAEFAKAIRGAVRGDPDTLMLGEVRDIESAQLAIKLTQVGHRMYTTLHAGSALGVVNRMERLEVHREELCATDILKGLIYQVLIPTLCADCRRPATDDPNSLPDDEYRKDLHARTRASLLDHGLQDDMIFDRGPGCPACTNGVNGRSLLAEVIAPDRQMLAYMSQDRMEDAYQQWIENVGGIPMMQSALQRIADGTMSPQDVEDAIGRLTLRHDYTHPAKIS